MVEEDVLDVVDAKNLSADQIEEVGKRVALVVQQKDERSGGDCGVQREADSRQGCTFNAWPLQELRVDLRKTLLHGKG